MRTYRVKMNNIQQNHPEEPEGVYYRHITSENLSKAAAVAEYLFPGACEAVTQKILSSPTFNVKDMEVKKTYELLATPKFTHDTITFRKIDRIIQITIRGKKFTEKGSTYWFDLSILDYMKRENQYTASPSITFSELEFISVEVYSIITQKQIPTIFHGLMQLGKWSS